MPPIHLVGGPDEATAQLIAHLKRIGVMNKDGSLCATPSKPAREKEPPRGPLDAFLKDCSCETNVGTAKSNKE